MIYNNCKLQKPEVPSSVDGTERFISQKVSSVSPWQAIDENKEESACFLIRSGCDLDSPRRPGIGGEGGDEARDGQVSASINLLVRRLPFDCLLKSWLAGCSELGVDLIDTDQSCWAFGFCGSAV